MTAYGIAHLRGVDLGPEIAEYLERIDATMTPYGARFLVHGSAPEALEGTWDGDLVVIEFPSMAAAKEWYDSPAYREILPLRTEHSTSSVVLVPGVADGYRAAALGESLRLSGSREIPPSA